MPDTAEPARRPLARAFFALNAAVAWAGLVLQLVLSAWGVYPSTETVGSIIGADNQPGAAGAIGRILDYFTYFTIWSNIVVAVVMTILALPRWRDTTVLRVARLDSLLMIIVTGLVYAIVLAPQAGVREGLQVQANFFEHQATPVLTFVVWLFFGPRGWIRWSIFLPALVVPVVWLVWMLLRGAVVGAYPYGFVDVVAHGYGTVLINIVGVLVLALVLCTILLGIDRLLTRDRD